MMAQEGFSANSRLNMTFDTGDYFLGELTFGVDTQCEKDMQRKEMSSATVLSMMNYEFGHVEIYGDNEKFCFSVPELLLENLYIENENVLDQYNHSYWADMFGKESGDDFSIDLLRISGFLQTRMGSSARSLRNMRGSWKSAENI